jgi:DNA-directed RNA polymerases I, II, and III subunit RPABC1
MSVVNKLFKSRGVIVEMLTLRGYDVSKYSNFSINEVEAMFKGSEKKTSAQLGSLDMSVVNSVGGKLHVKYLLASKLRNANFKTLIDEMITEFLHSGDEVIFILKDSVNNMDAFDSMLEGYLSSTGVYIQIFSLDNLSFNITKHDLVPKMRIMSPEEQLSILERYQVSPSQMPQILKSDPQAKFLGVRKGDMCEIIRASETAGYSYTYRMCLQT